MGLFTRSRRSRIATFAVVIAGFLTVTPSKLLAQNSAGAADEPALVVTIGPINKLMQDVNYISGAVGQPQIGGLFAMMAGMYTQGIDPTQPIGVIVTLEDGVPQPIALVPSKDVKQTLRMFEATTGPADELSDGTLVIAVGANTVYIRQVGDWAVVAADRTQLDSAPKDPSAALKMGLDYDLAVKVNPQQVPQELRTMLVSQIRQGYEQAMAMQTGDDSEAVQQMAETTIAQLEQLINDTESLDFGLNINQEAKRIDIDVKYIAVAGSDLAETYSTQQPVPSRFASVIREDAAAYYHAASSVSPDTAEQSRSSMNAMITSLPATLAQDNMLTPEQREELTKLIEQIVGLAVDTISEGRVDMGAVLLADKDNLRLAFGAGVADGARVEQIVQELAEKFEGAPNAPTFSFNIGTYNGVTMHLVESPVPASEEEVRKAFGDTLRVHLGTGPKVVYGAFGKGSEDLMKELIDSADRDTGGDRPISQLRAQLKPIMEFAQQVTDNELVAAMASSLSQSDEGGKVALVFNQIENGQDLTLSIGEGVLTAIGAAFAESQRGQQGF